MGEQLLLVGFDAVEFQGEQFAGEMDIEADLSVYENAPWGIPIDPRGAYRMIGSVSSDGFVLKLVFTWQTEPNANESGEVCRTVAIREPTRTRWFYWDAEIQAYSRLLLLDEQRVCPLSVRAGRQTPRAGHPLRFGRWTELLDAGSRLGAAG